MDLAAFIRDIPDFPKKGILFKDITPLLRDASALRAAADEMAAPWRDLHIDRVAGIESRGFLFGTMIAERLGAGFVPVRKPGKLPAATWDEEYSLEYGTDRIEMHRDGIAAGDHVLLVDDLLATGGTAAAAARLVGRAGGRLAGAQFLIELDFLAGHERLPGLTVRSLLHYGA